MRGIAYVFLQTAQPNNPLMGVSLSGISGLHCADRPAGARETFIPNSASENLTLMGFKDITTKMAALGVRIVPARPGLKYSNKSGWPDIATTDAAMIQHWHKENANYNCVSVPKRAEVCIIDVDDAATVSASLPFLLPKTFKVSTPSGGYHLYFKATEKSDALGNRDVIVDGKPILELKIQNKTAASPGSVTAKGEYEIVQDMHELPPIPDKLVVRMHLPRLAARLLRPAVLLDPFVLNRGGLFPHDDDLISRHILDT